MPEALLHRSGPVSSLLVLVLVLVVLLLLVLCVALWRRRPLRLEGQQLTQVQECLAIKVQLGNHTAEGEHVLKGQRRVVEGVAAGAGSSFETEVGL